jgi:surface antigen
VRGITAIALLSAVALAAARPGAADVVVYGYPLATRCPAAGIAESVDRYGMFVCNCTSYVAWALAANGQRTGWFVRGSMDAWNWPNVARRARIPVGRTPRVGAVAVWPKLVPPFGHVAYVTGLEPGGRFDVAEYNFDADIPAAALAFDTRTDIPPAGALFIYVPRRSPINRRRE